MLKAALKEADLRVLLMVLVHHTGDLSWLEPPFCPGRDVRLIPAIDASLPEDVQDTIRSAALKVLLAKERLRLVDPGNDLMHRMMSVTIGERVPYEYAELNREEMGLLSRFVEPSGETVDEPVDRHVLIVGAGVCGIALAVALKKMGIPFTIVEKTQVVGGTWSVNRYPGCGVDTPNHAYSYSFGPSYAWSRYFSPREEVQGYLNRVVEMFDLKGNIAFETRLQGATWDEASASWTCSTERAGKPEVVHTRYLVGAIGQLSDPSIPRIEGAETFRGTKFHSVDWPEDLNLAGKRLAVIGTGATAMQLVPTIADSAQHVAVYQRTAQWSRQIPGYSDPLSSGVRYLLEHVPMYAQWFRFNMFWRYGDGLLRHLKWDPEWPHPERAVNRVNDRHRKEMTEFIESQLKDRPDLVPKCLPDYPPYGKRILLDNNWYGTIQKESVELITDSIECITEDGIRTRSGEHRPADIIVYATGFKLTELAARLNVVGRGGLSLAQAWKDDNPAAYLGLMVPNFPNFFTMLGPGSGPGHGGSAVFQAECQARYISACIRQMQQHRLASIDIKASEFEAYLNKADAEHKTLIWSHPGVSTYYKNQAGRVFTVMPWRFVDYWRMTHDPSLEPFETVALREAADAAG